MFLTTAGIPAGYGYLEETAVVGENIMPALMTALRDADPDESLGAPILAGRIMIRVSANAKVSINCRRPVLVMQGQPLRFDARGIYSIAFQDAVAYDVTVTY